MSPPTEGGEFLYGPGFLGLENKKEKQRENLLAYPGPVPNSTVILLAHGGWWHADTEKELEGEQPNFQLQKQAEDLNGEGFAVVLMNYPEDLDPVAGSGSTLYPENQFKTINAFPAQPECVKKAAEWIIVNAAKINADPNKLVIMGGSTGGNIALLGTQKFNDASPGIVKACIALSPPTNLVTLYEWSMKNKEEGVKGKPTEGAGNVARACGAKITDMPHPTNPLAVQPEPWSPALNVTSTRQPPTYLYGGVLEQIVPYFQQEEMVEACAIHGIAVHLLTLPGGGHSFEAWKQVRPDMINWLHEIGL